MTDYLTLLDLYRTVTQHQNSKSVTVGAIWHIAPVTNYYSLCQTELTVQLSVQNAELHGYCMTDAVL